ncbi:FxSxx-COOH system tetratricopeptide repeat protein [Streptomyces sp. NPDC049040]|uniref:FxSxx-COOH system tetratricopeptide repeat protein n=1 Tax=Streptomyces sp. NPDC049040 TaxID=3365593 RepID=UPI0037148BCE
MSHGTRWALTVAGSIAAFGLFWPVLEWAGLGEAVVLACAPTAGATVLAVGGWYAGREPTAAAAPAAPAAIVVGALPRRPLGYQQRGEASRALRDAARPGRVVVVSTVTGARGVGKTQLAAAFARECAAEKWRAVVWVVAEPAGQIVTGLAELAGAAGVRGPLQSAELAAAAARQWLEELREPSLLVLDNATDPDETARWLPRTGRTTVVVTSTLRSFSLLGTSVELDVFTEREALDFLVERSGRTDDRDAARVVRALDRLPLALAQAAWVIRTQNLTFAQYAERFDRNPASDVLPHVPGECYPQSAATVLLLAVGDVEGSARAAHARAVVDLMALMSPNGVDRDILYALAPGERAGMDRTVGSLADASLVFFAGDGAAVLMHRLVQRVLRERLAGEGRLDTAVARAADVLRGLGDRTDPVLRGLAAHVDSLWAGARPLGDGVLVTLLDLRLEAVRRLGDDGDLAGARALGEEVLADHLRLPCGDDAVATARAVLSHVYMLANLPALSVPLVEQSLAASRRSAGPDAVGTLMLTNSLGYHLEAAGRLDDAIRTHAVNLRDCLRVCGPDAQATLYVQVNLASCYRAQGRSAEALELFEKNAADNLRAHGPDHPSTLNARGELARMYGRVGRHQDSLALYDDILDGYRRLHGPDHTMNSWWQPFRSLALQGIGRHREALDLLSGLLSESADRLGRDHPETLRVQIFLARAYASAGRFGASRSLLVRTIADRSRVVGPDHPSTLNARRNLGCVCLAAGSRVKGKRLLEAVVRDYVRVLGADHPFTRTAEENLLAARADQATPFRR